MNRSAEMDWCYDKGRAPIELLPNEILQSIWFFSLSLELPYTSPTLSSKIQTKATRDIFLQTAEREFDFIWFSEDPDNVEPVEEARDRDLGALCVQRLIESPKMDARIFTLIQRAATTQLKKRKPEFSISRFYLPSFGLPSGVVAPPHLVADPHEADNVCLFADLLRKGAKRPVGVDLTQIAIQCLNLGNLHAFTIFLEHGTLIDISPGLLNLALKQAPKMEKHMKQLCVASFFTHIDYYPKPALHKAFGNFTRARYPLLWDWAEQNIELYQDFDANQATRFDLRVRISRNLDRPRTDGESLKRYLEHWAEKPKAV